MSGRANRKVRSALGTRLRALRRQARFSQERLGDRAGLSGKFIGEVERGEKSISVDSLRNVAIALEIPLRDLVDGIDGSEPTAPLVEQIAALARRQSPTMLQRMHAVVRALTSKAS